MFTPQNNIPATLTRPWTIFRPPVYRYLEPKYVEEFFSVGRLRLSSFVEFKKLHDDERRDENEGVNHLYFQNKEAQFGVGTVMSHGEDAYVFCTCLQLDPDRMKRWGGSYIRINDMMNFVGAIAAHIPAFKGGLEGPCVYLENRLITGDSGKLTHGDMQTTGPNPNVDLRKVIETSQSLAGPSVFFTKLRKHSIDQEYRFLWLSSRPCKSEFFIECPEAREFCSPPPAE